MANAFSNWVATERTYIDNELKWLKAGGKLISPSGTDITAAKIEELELRMEHANKIMKELGS